MFVNRQRTLRHVSAISHLQHKKKCSQKAQIRYKCTLHSARQTPNEETPSWTLGSQAVQLSKYLHMHLWSTQYSNAWPNLPALKINNFISHHLESENYIHLLIGLTIKQFIDVSVLFLSPFLPRWDNCMSLGVFQSHHIKSNLHSIQFNFCCKYVLRLVAVARVQSLTAYVRVYVCCVQPSSDTLFLCVAIGLLCNILAFFSLLVDTSTAISTMRKMFVWRIKYILRSTKIIENTNSFICYF